MWRTSEAAWLLRFFIITVLTSGASWAFTSNKNLQKKQLRLTKASNGTFYFNKPHATEVDSELQSNSYEKDPLRNGNLLVVSRRASLASVAGIASAFNPKLPAIATTNIDGDGSTVIDNFNPARIPSITIPLQYQSSLSAYTISYKVGSATFGAIIDTGSPFLLAPQPSETTCRPEYKWGCLKTEETRPAGLDPTVERFDGNQGLVDWRKGEFSFSDILSPNNDYEAVQFALFPNSLLTFGVISESLMDGPGGIFLGLIKNTDDWIRPSFLGQTNISAFSIDLREREGVPKSLALYAGDAKMQKEGEGDNEMSSFLSHFCGVNKEETILPVKNAIRCSLNLHKRYGDPTVHYVGLASLITVNGSNLASSSWSNGKIYCIFDTGCSGMSISPSLFDERYATARARREKNLWGSVEVELKTTSGDTLTLSANRPITTPLSSDAPWGRKLDGHLIVLGLSFLEGLRMTVDPDRGYVWFED